MAKRNEVCVTDQEEKMVAKIRQEKFKNSVRDLWENNMELIQQTLRDLEPKERMDVLLRLLPYGFSKVPEEKSEKPTIPQGGSVEVVRETYRQKLDQ